MKKRWPVAILLAVLLVVLGRSLWASRIDTLLYQGLDIADAATVSVTTADKLTYRISSVEWRKITAGGVQVSQSKAEEQLHNMEAVKLEITLQNGKTLTATPGELNGKPAVSVRSHTYMFDKGSLETLTQVIAKAA